MGFRGLLAYGGLALFWATFFCGLTAAVSALGPALAVGLLFLLGGLALLGLARLVGRKPRWHLNWGTVLVWACIILVIAGATAVAMSTIGAGLTAIVVSSIPLFATVAGQMRGLERVTGLGAVSLFLGIGGLMLVAAFPAGGASWGYVGGVLAALIAAIVAGASGRELDAKLRSPRALEIAVAAMGIAGAVALVFIGFAPPTSAGPGSMLGVALLSLGCAFLTLFALSSASDSVPRRTAATLPGVGTVLAVLGGIIVLHEPMSLAQGFGLLLILAGTALLRGLVPSWFPQSWRA